MTQGRTFSPWSISRKIAMSTPSASEPKAAQPSQRTTRGAWKANETHVLPENRLWIVALGLMCCVFLAAIDQTIVATALPTIVADLGGGQNYSWVGSAYLLAAASLSPLYGKLSDLVGRKPVLYSSIAIFLIGSALCGAAQSSTWLIVCRAVQGIGGGGILQLVNITIADIVPLDQRGKWNGIIGATWGVASVVGPLLGGIFTDHVSWRWCFWINLPTGGVAAVLLFFFLNLNPHRGRTLKEHVQDFDFIGLALMIAGVICLLLGFNSSETDWKSPETITLLIVGGLLLASAAIYECYTGRSPILPPRLFKTRTTAAALASAFLHALTFFNGAYYLPLYFQILGASATGAGIRMLPFSLGSSVFSAIGGVLVAVTKDYQIIMWISWAIYTLGWGLCIMLDSHSTMTQKMLFTLIPSIGCGPLFLGPLIALQAAMPMKDMATSTAAMGFVRIMGSTVGVAVGQVIFTSFLSKRLDKIPNLPISASAAALSESVKHLKDIPDPVQRAQIIQAFAKSVSSIWLIMTPIAGVGFLLSLLVRKYSLNTVTSRAPGEKSSKDSDVEKNEIDDNADKQETTVNELSTS